MLKEMHEHLLKELAQNKQINTIFLILGIVFNLMMLAINSAAQSSKDYSFIIIFFLLGIIVSAITVIVLVKNTETRNKIVNGLYAMYEDNNVSKYFDRTMIKNDNFNNRLEIIVIIVTCVTSIVIPVLLKVIYKGEV
jgi:hypothetical protein